MLSLYNEFPDIFDTLRYINGYDVSSRRKTSDFIDENGIKIEMPGVKASDLEVSINDRIIKISGKSRHGREFSYTYRLKSDVDESTITAKLEDGLLDVTLPKKASTISRKIPVMTS